MKRIIFTMLFILAACVSYAQQKVTYEQATTLISQYQERQASAEQRVNAEKSKIDTLRNEIAVLDAEIANLTSQVALLKASQESKKAEPQGTYYVVKPGDFLAKLAEYPEVYGRGNYAKWPKIYHANKDLIKDPTLIQPGWKLRVPR